jgi:hypothetical protein
MTSNKRKATSQKVPDSSKSQKTSQSLVTSSKINTKSHPVVEDDTLPLDIKTENALMEYDQKMLLWSMIFPVESCIIF